MFCLERLGTEKAPLETQYLDLNVSKTAQVVRLRRNFAMQTREMKKER